ncbi:MAG: hypothetical protein AB8B74_10915 [Crocinitomicaceae bacterium]
MRQLFILYMIIIGSPLSLFCQKDKGAIFGQFNTVLIYSNYTINYETKSLFSTSEKHNLMLTAGIGGWSTSAFNKNSGVVVNYGINYLFGSNSHLLEVDLNYQNHFDKGLKGQLIVFIGSTFRPFLGYRYQPKEGKVFFKIGTGWREVLQMGLGFRL